MAVRTRRRGDDRPNIRIVDGHILPSSTVSKADLLGAGTRWSPFEHVGDPASTGETAVWLGGLSPAKLWELSDENQDRLLRLFRVLVSHEAWEVWETGSRQLFGAIVARAAAEPQPMQWLTLWGAEDEELILRAAYAYSRLIDGIMDRRNLMADGDKLVPIGPVLSTAGLLAGTGPVLRAAARRVLYQCALPQDFWHETATVSRLLCPRLALFAAGQQWWIDPPPEGLSDLERQSGTAVGATEEVERVAYRAKREMRRALGRDTDRRKPGPKPGSTRRPSPALAERDAYIRARARQGVQPYSIVEDAEANRLHGQARGDMNARLTQQIVQRVIRGH